jgi:hypothetical protein
MNAGNSLSVPREAMDIMDQFYTNVLCAKQCRRLEIAKLLTEERKAREIAATLGMTRSNVKHQVGIMKAESGCSSLHGLTAYLSFVLMMKNVLWITVNGSRKNEKKIKFSHQIVLLDNDIVKE